MGWDGLVCIVWDIVLYCIVLYCIVRETFFVKVSVSFLVFSRVERAFRDKCWFYVI